MNKALSSIFTITTKLNRSKFDLQIIFKKIYLVPSTSLTITYKPNMINKSMVCIFCYTFRQYGYFWNMRVSVISYSKTVPALFWLNSENHSSTFYLITWIEEIDCSRKYGKQNNAFWTHKNYNMRNRRMRVCRPLLKWRNEIMQIYLPLTMRPQKSWCGDYAKHDRNNIN